MTAEWKKYTGSDEQTDEINNAKNGWIHKTRDGTQSEIRRNKASIVEYAGNEVTHYLICQPHPYADMICQWTRTGQPVYWKSKVSGWTGLCHEYFPPFMHPVDFEYSFTSF